MVIIFWNRSHSPQVNQNLAPIPRNYVFGSSHKFLNDQKTSILSNEKILGKFQNCFETLFPSRNNIQTILVKNYACIRRYQVFFGPVQFRMISLRCSKYFTISSWLGLKGQLFGNHLLIMIF